MENRPSKRYVKFEQILTSFNVKFYSVSLLNFEINSACFINLFSVLQSADNNIDFVLFLSCYKLLKVRGWPWMNFKARLFDV